MEMLTSIFLLALGFLILIKGADWFVDGASGIATKLGIPQIVIGLTIVAMGTSAPEAAVSVAAAFSGNSGITIGNVIGSNIMNVLLILGITSVIVKVPIQKATLKIDIPFMLGVTVLTLILGYRDGIINFTDGIILWIIFIVYLGYLFKISKDDNSDEVHVDDLKSTELPPLWKQLIALVVGLVCIVYGSDMTVENATVIAKILGMDDRLIGLTIIAFGTSLPELVTSATAALKGNADIAIGNIVGSNIFNLLFVVGTSALIIPISFAPAFIVDFIISISAGILLVLGVAKTGALGRKLGLTMLLGYAVYFTYLLLG